MLSKRLIFTLLFNNGNYMLSRNFVLQKVGDLNWLRKNYNFSKISCSIDELIVLNVSRNIKDQVLFSEHIKELTSTENETGSLYEQGVDISKVAELELNEIDKSINYLQSL